MQRPVKSDDGKTARKINEMGAINEQGKNWYAQIDGYIITVNASSYTIITAHKEK